MEIQSIGYQDKELSIFCNIKSNDDLKTLAFIISGFMSGYFCNETEPEEILEILEELMEDFELDENILYKLRVSILRDREGIKIGYRKIAKYEIAEERKLKLLESYWNEREKMGTNT